MFYVFPNVKKLVFLILMNMLIYPVAAMLKCFQHVSVVDIIYVMF